MDENRLFEVLHELGLSRREAEIYVYLVKKGPQRAHTAAVNLRIERVQTYRSLTSLHEKGLVEATIETPTRYVAVPLPPLIESLIRNKRSEVTRLETDKQEIINYWKDISAKEPQSPMARFQVVMGKKAIYSKISQMIKESKKEVLTLTTSLGVIQEDMAGILDDIINSAQEKREAQFKILANITKENAGVIKQAVQGKPARNPNIEWRHIDPGSRSYPRFVVKDEEETILYVTSKDELSMVTQEDTGLWITSSMFTSTLRISFMEIWRDAVDASERINQLETGTPIEETIILRDTKEAQARVKEALDAAKTQVTVILSAAGLNRMAESDALRRYMEKGVKFRIMAPIDLDNFEAAERLSKLEQIRHVAISYLNMMVIDGKHLFTFRTPSIEEAANEAPFYLHNAFYSNDQRYIRQVTEMLDDMWKRGTDISELTSEAKMKMPVAKVLSSDTVSKVVEVMLKNKASSVLVTDKGKSIGIINERDILEKTVKPRKDPEKTHAREVMSTPIMTMDVEQPLIEAIRTMRAKGITRLAVMRKGKLVGMLTEKHHRSLD